MGLLDDVPNWAITVLIIFIILFLSLISIDGKTLLERVVVGIVSALSRAAEIAFDSARRISWKLALSIIFLLLIIGTIFGLNNPDVISLADQPYATLGERLFYWLTSAMISGFEEVVDKIIDAITGVADFVGGS